jgi:hypothetical protein
VGKGHPDVSSTQPRNRLHALCPYFAMFPEKFAETHIRRWTIPGDVVLDPFSGRGTTMLTALLIGRRAAAVDVNPVAYVVTGAKASPPDTTVVASEVEALRARYELAGQVPIDLPEYFQWAFSERTLNQLTFLRGVLNWRGDPVHRWVAAVVLGILHGELGRSSRYLSNQMPRTISPKPAYSVRYWSRMGLQPPERDVFTRVQEETLWRLRSPRPAQLGTVVLGDARDAGRLLGSLTGQIGAVITSPPYFDTTDFEEDQWLRLWFLGGPPRVTYGTISRDDRHENEQRYWAFLREAFGGLAPLLKPGAAIVCRIGSRRFSPTHMTERLVEVMTTALAGVRLCAEPEISPLGRRQTNAFRPGSTGVRVEIDHVFKFGVG